MVIFPTEFQKSTSSWRRKGKGNHPTTDLVRPCRVYANDVWSALLPSQSTAHSSYCATCAV